MAEEGWRRYEVRRLKGDFFLTGMKIAWPTKTLVAECLRGEQRTWGDEGTDLRRVEATEHLLWNKGGEHPAHTGPGHSCGIYMLPSRDDLHCSEPSFGYFDALCSADGVIAEYEKGVRAQNVTIESLHLLYVYHDADQTEQMLIAIAARYGVPIDATDAANPPPHWDWWA
tara:strand:- start:1015 stop:1524 length:510 start_codon:yes stop_codon:yes gene_type:complete